MVAAQLGHAVVKGLLLLQLSKRGQARSTSLLRALSNDSSVENACFLVSLRAVLSLLPWEGESATLRR